jgi:hypothetical protein
MAKAATAGSTPCGTACRCADRDDVRSDGSVTAVSLSDAVPGEQSCPPWGGGGNAATASVVSGVGLSGGASSAFCSSSRSKIDNVSLQRKGGEAGRYVGVVVVAEFKVEFRKPTKREVGDDRRTESCIIQRSRAEH